ncbi:MAG TPA: cupin domain-containing protein [Minicystis sp.]|nr:cupin domain-containing protein [Minicystis sp.]
MVIKLSLVAALLAASTACGARAPEPETPAFEARAAAAQVQKMPFSANVLEAARTNDAYRRVLFTGARTQLAVMTIPVGGDIGAELHANVEQIFVVVAGSGKLVLGGSERALAPGDVVVVTPGSRHDVVNDGTEPLRLYTVYAPPNHLDGTVHATKADAAADRADEAFGHGVR